MSVAPEAELEPLREAVRQLAGVVADQQAQLDALREAFGCFSSPAALAQSLSVFDALKAGRDPAPAVEVPAVDPYAWI
jgi:hypothetical protein